MDPLTAISGRPGYLSVWAGVLDLQNGNLTYVSAGHNPPVLIRSGNAEYLKAKNGFVLAGLGNVKYKEADLQLMEGDTLFLYTDGVTEASTKENELYGNDRLLACLAECTGAGVQAVLESVKESVDGFVQDNEQFDDITMLCLKWK